MLRPGSRTLPALLTAALVLALLPRPAAAASAPAPVLTQDVSDGVRRLGGATRLETAVAVRRAAIPASAVRRVLLVPGGGEGWQQTLPAASLLSDATTAYVLTGTELPLSPTVTEELDELLTGGAPVLVVGGPADGISTEVEEEIARSHPRSEVRRLEGAEAGPAALAVAIADVLQPADLDDVLIATSARFPDALAMAAVAADRGAPLLYAPPSAGGGGPTCSWLERNATSATTLHLAGGIAAIPEDVATALGRCAGGAQVVRYGAPERIGTAGVIGAAFFPEPESVALAKSGDWPDAVTGAVLARAERGPILLTADMFGDPARVDDQLEQVDVELICTRLPAGATAYLLGGEAAVTTEKAEAVRRTLARCPVASSGAEHPPIPSDAIVLEPGDDLQAALDAGAEGDAFGLSAGVHLLRSPLRPQARQRIVGASGAVLSGAGVVEDAAWTRVEGPQGPRWRATDRSRRFCVHGDRDDPTATFAEDLAVAGMPLAQVPYEDVDALEPGQFAVEYDPDHPRRVVPDPDPEAPRGLAVVVEPEEELGNGCDNEDLDATPEDDAYVDVLWLAEDPATLPPIEVNLAPQALVAEPGADGGVLAGVGLSSFGNLAQRGAVDVARAEDWTLAHLDVSLAHGVGVRLGTGSTLTDSRIHHNGQLGVAVSAASADEPPESVRADGARLAHVEIDHNNVAGYDQGWEAGGSKFVKTDDLEVSRTWVHDNAGGGLWTDIDNRATRYRENLVTDNERAGIWHEISRSAEIVRNTVARNGFVGSNATADFYSSSAGIFISSSRGADGAPIVVAENVVRHNRHGLAVTDQDRDVGPVDGVRFERNLVDLTPDPSGRRVFPTDGFSGLAEDRMGRTDEEETVYFSPERVRFTANHYRTVANDRPFVWCGAPRTASDWRAYGQDEGGTLNGAPLPTGPTRSCP